MKTIPLLILILLSFSSCTKWKDKAAPDLGLTNKYCNLPSAINYNQNFPGIEDNSVCVFPSTPFVGRYVFQDSIYDQADVLTIGNTYDFQISVVDSFRFAIQNFCSSGSLLFKADRYYKATSDSVISPATQLFCRNLDTLSGTLLYRGADSSLYFDWTVVSDTAINFHKGRAYKK